jgi:hypothetical protein
VVGGRYAPQARELTTEHPVKDCIHAPGSNIDPGACCCLLTAGIHNSSRTAPERALDEHNPAIDRA